MINKTKMHEDSGAASHSKTKQHNMLKEQQKCCLIYFQTRSTIQLLIPIEYHEKIISSISGHR